MPDIYEKLVRQGYAPHHTLTGRKDMSVKENRTEYRLQLDKRRPTASYQVDGKIITSGNKCDYLMLVCHDEPQNQWTEVFVELKGCDVEHAITQLEATIGADILKHKCVNRRLARIVALSFPSHKSNPALEKAKRRFRAYSCDLKTIKTKQPDNI